MNNPITWFKLARALLRHDRTAFYALRTVRAMHGAPLAVFAPEIIRFLNHRYPAGRPLEAYLARGERLRQLQRTFEAAGRYPAGSYAEVQPVPDDIYKLSLLLSFICTNHRFEILLALDAFLREPVSAPPRLLSVGYGTGYELKLARNHLPDWAIEAFDASPESFAYATDLLAFFACDPVTLRQEYFPLETTAGLDQYRDCFGKIVVCELLEHLEHPAEALVNLAAALHPQGRIFLTMAINIAQEDHVFLYRTPEQARDQVLAAGFEIVGELVTPVVGMPFDEPERRALCRKGNYVCVARRRS